MLRYHIIFKGRVQGVGFRFTTERLARELGIVGWVRNNPNGEVEVMAEAVQERLELFLSGIKDYFDEYIGDVSLKEGPADGSFKEFRIGF